ncbi:hypothetical protein C8R46DRAFT_207764 [Mycena filopes]|nr:hypothetical protein C8R46DRAFT_207764 [Mycena filopes]
MSALDTTEHTPHHKPPRRSRHPSTTSIRSTASARSPRPTVWRPPNSLRVRNDSLSSATDARLSVIVVGAELSGNTVNVRDRMEALHFTAPVAGPSSPAPSATSDLPHEIPEILEADSDVTSLATLTELADKPILDGTNLIAFPPSVSPPASRASSWFGSISRAKGKEKLAEVHATASTPNLLAPASSIPIPVPDAAPSPSASEPVTSSEPRRPRATRSISTGPSTRNLLRRSEPQAPLSARGFLRPLCSLHRSARPLPHNPSLIQYTYPQRRQRSRGISFRRRSTHPSRPPWLRLPPMSL